MSSKKSLKIQVIKIMYSNFFIAKHNIIIKFVNIFTIKKSKKIKKLFTEKYYYIQKFYFYFGTFYFFVYIYYNMIFKTCSFCNNCIFIYFNSYYKIIHNDDINFYHSKCYHKMNSKNILEKL